MRDSLLTRHVVAAMLLALGTSVSSCAPARDVDSGAEVVDVVASDVVRADASTGWTRCGVAGTGCDPTNATACDPGQRCAITSFFPQLTGSCVPVGTGAFGQPCDASNICSAGLECIEARCLPLCCGETDDTSCAASAGSSASRCVVPTYALGLHGCSIPGACDYISGAGCSAGENCYPQSPFGEAICAPFGSAAENDTCQRQTDCASGLTCSNRGSPFGTCRPVCDPRHGACTLPARCTQFNGRPEDYGACIDN